MDRDEKSWSHFANEQSFRTMTQSPGFMNVNSIGIKLPDRNNHDVWFYHVHTGEILPMYTVASLKE
jgi:hypothetical protein